MPDDPIVVEVEGLGLIEFPAGTSGAQMEAALRQATMQAKRGEPSILDRAVNVAVNALPAIGGAAGGIIGGIGGTVAGMGVGGVPGAIGGATVGGAAGEAFRQLIERARGNEAPSTPGEAAAAIGTEGAVQGAMEGVGGALVGGAAKVGRSLMENAIRPPIGMAREFPNIVETAIKERIPVGRVWPEPKAGSEVAKDRLNAAAQDVKDRLDYFTRMGARFQPTQLQQELGDLMIKIQRQPIGDAEAQRLGDLISEFMRRHKGPLTPLAMKKLKQDAQAIAEPIFKAAARGEVPGPEQALSARFHGALASGAKRNLETLPGIAEGEARTQSLIGAQRAISQAELRRMSLMAESLSGASGIVAAVLAGQGGGLDDSVKTGAISYLIARGLMSPKTLSRGALTLTKPQLRELFRQFPRLAEAVVSEAGVKPTRTGAMQ